MLQIDDKAPNLTLQNTEAEEVSLGDFKGKENVLLLFFPLTFSGVCTKELCQTRDNLKLYESFGVKVLAISIDSFFVLKEFKQAQNLNFQLLSDFNKEVSKKYDVLYKEFYGMKGVAKRSAFVIDKQGTIKYTEVLENADELPSFEAIQDTLQTLGKK